MSALRNEFPSFLLESYSKEQDFNPQTIESFLSYTHNTLMEMQEGNTPPQGSAELLSNFPLQSQLSEALKVRLTVFLEEVMETYEQDPSRAVKLVEHALESLRDEMYRLPSKRP
jgi:hypothetical protein